MFNKVKNGIVTSTLGLTLTVFSSNAFSAGPVTFLWYEASFYTLLVTAGGVSCGFQTQNIEPAKIAGAVAILATAKATGKNVTISCNSGSFQVSM